MAQIHDSMVDPRIEVLLSKVDSRFTLVSLGAQRARQINAYFNQLGEGQGSNVPPQVTSLARKPLSIAFEEISADMIIPVRVDPNEVLEEDVVEGIDEITDAKVSHGDEGTRGAQLASDSVAAARSASATPTSWMGLSRSLSSTHARMTVATG